MSSDKDNSELNPVANLLGEMIEVETENLDITEEEAREKIETSLSEVFEAEREARKSESGDFDVPQHLETLPVSMALPDCLSRLPVFQLDTIFDNLSFDGRPSRREQRESSIVGRLQEADVVESILRDELDTICRELCDYLMNYQSEVSAQAIFDEGVVDFERDWLYFDPSSPLGRLRRYGLVHVGLRKENGVSWVYLGIPNEVRSVVGA